MHDRYPLARRQVALVTGAYKGIGAGVATAFAAAGAKVVVGYARDREGAERVVGEIRTAGGQAITKVLALELAGRKIRVNAIMPGYFDTEGARAIGVKGSVQEAHLIAATPWNSDPAVLPT